MTTPLDTNFDTAADATGADALRPQAIRLFTYLKELSELRTKTVRSLDGYERVVWLADVPRAAECRSAAWFDGEGDESPETWIEIRKPRLSPPPEPPAALTDWLDPRQVADSALDAPGLRDRIPIAPSDDDDDLDQEPTYRELSECPEIPALWERYVRERWLPWAEEDRCLQPVQRVYADLFAIYQRQQRLGEQYEVVLGLGLLGWRSPSGHLVNRHLITAQTSLAFDPVRGTISVAAAGEGAKPALEQDMLEALERPDAVEQQTVERQLAALGDGIWDKPALDALLAAWVHAVSSRGRYDDDLARPPDVGNDPRVALAPAIILRRRTERSLIRVFQEISAQLREGGDVPLGVRRLLEVVDDAAEAEHAAGSNGAVGPEGDVLFPLPANGEQIEIVRRLATRQGVLVQGPPGTGKSHTIANLVCHLLASGRRVLVTSHAPRALRVLREKIPPEVAPLCVSLLGDDRAALQNLEDAVHGITDRLDHWRESESDAAIAAASRALSAARRREAQALHDLRALRERETHHYPLRFGDYEGTAAAIARRVGAEAGSYGWLTVRPGAETEPPLSVPEVGGLLTLTRELTAERVSAARQTLPAPDLLPDPGAFAALVQAEAAARQPAEAMAAHRAHPAFPSLRQATAAQRQALRDGLASLHEAQAALALAPTGWTRPAATEVLAGQERVWRELREATRAQLAAILRHERASVERRVAGLNGRDRALARADAVALLAHLERGGSLGVGFLRPKVVKTGHYLLTDVAVDGRRCDQPEPLRALVAALDVADHLDRLRQLWAAHAEVPPGPLATQVAAYRDRLDLLDRVLDLGAQVAALRPLCAEIPGLTEPVWQDADAVSALGDAIVAATLDAALAAAGVPLDDPETGLRATASQPNAHPVVAEIAAAVRARDEAAYADAFATVGRLAADREAIARRDELHDRLAAAAPGLASLLEKSAADPIWDERCAHFGAAWNWARADRWLDELSDPATERTLAHELATARGEIERATRELAGARAWRHFFARMSEHERQALYAWTYAMRRIGKGTGKYAGRHRADARRHMEACRSAIPAWIMPIYRVAESVHPARDAFDVVIVDEASQSGPEALFLQYIAKQIVVVGDDKQISPEFVGLDREDVNVLRERHIADLPHSDALGVDNSFFDQAAIRYGGRIRLREHFRCMPEIIQFSNNLSYPTEPLIPLRQYGAERLPPVRTTHVEDGYRQGSDARITNPPEAEALVGQIAACCHDPAYDGKTFGVISLQGGAQAQLIEDMLLQELGPEEIERRRLTCGDAYAFQGDERDVMFLSLVAAPSDEFGAAYRPRALASTRDERRFNVAASRARDQLWLFHTATPADLSPECLRRRLLEYCLHPALEPTAFAGEMPADDLLVPPFESLFEQHVFAAISARGYRVLPQVEVAGYRIDLVVEGMQGRLAVECDGDTWHGPEHYEADAFRQRQLERCGWTFWRVRASAFYRDREASLDGLWKTLGRLGIDPERAIASAVDDGMVPASPGDQAEPGPVHDGPMPFAPYRVWRPRPLPDPRTAALDEVSAGLAEIVAAEGPIPCHRVYRLYAAALGLGEMAPPLRSTFNRAMFRAIQQGRVAERNEHGKDGQVDKIVRLAGSPPVVVRERGDRLLNEIPPSELGSVMLAQTLTGVPNGVDPEPLFRRALQLYGLERLSDSVWQTALLQRAYAMMHHDAIPDPQTQLALELG